MFELMRKDRHVPHGGKVLPSPDVIEVPVREHDRGRRHIAPEPLFGRTEDHIPSSEDTRIYEDPIGFSRFSMKDRIDDTELQIGEVGRYFPHLSRRVGLFRKGVWLKRNLPGHDDAAFLRAEPNA